MHVTITAGARTACIVPAELLGHNLELFDRAVKDLSNDLLANPKFAGPADPSTGIAHDWRSPNSNFMVSSMSSPRARVSWAATRRRW